MTPLEYLLSGFLFIAVWHGVVMFFHCRHLKEEMDRRERAWEKEFRLAKMHSPELFEKP